MAVLATGSTLVKGILDGMTSSFVSGTSLARPVLIYVDGDPDKIVTSTTGSDLAFDIGGGKVYIGDVTNGAGGSTWTELT